MLGPDIAGRRNVHAPNIVRDGTSGQRALSIGTLPVRVPGTNSRGHAFFPERRMRIEAKNLLSGAPKRGEIRPKLPGRFPRREFLIPNS